MKTPTEEGQVQEEAEESPDDGSTMSYADELEHRGLRLVLLLHAEF